MNPHPRIAIRVVLGSGVSVLVSSGRVVKRPRVPRLRVLGVRCANGYAESYRRSGSLWRASAAAAGASASGPQWVSPLPLASRPPGPTSAAGPDGTLPVSRTDRRQCLLDIEPCLVVCLRHRIDALCVSGRLVEVLRVL